MDRPERKEVQKAIAQLQKLGMSREAIAGELRVSFTSVRNWDLGKSSPIWPVHDAMLAMLHKLKKESKK